MNLGEISESIRLISGKSSTTDLDDMIRSDVNRAYRKLCRGRSFGALVVRGEQFTTVSATYKYALPYPLERIINDSLRYDVTTLQPGGIVEIRDAGSVERTLASGLYPSGGWPIVASVGSGANIEWNTEGGGGGRIDIEDGEISYTSEVNDGSTAGRWIRFSQSPDGKNGGDYGYFIESNNSGFVSTLTYPYHGPTLTNCVGYITPAESQWLFFDPQFTDTAKVVQYDWYRKPQRLWGDYQVPEVAELSDAIVYRVLADNPMYHRPQSYDRLNYVEQARAELVAALKTGLQ